MKSILLLAALPEEADAFRPGENCLVEGEPVPVRIVETDGTRIKIVTCGLGKVNAALAHWLATKAHVWPDLPAPAWK